VGSLARLTLKSNVRPMPYPASFHRLVILGTLYSDTFNVTLSIVPGLTGSMPAVPQTLANSLGAAIGTWWDDTYASTGASGLSITGNAAYTGIKLNRINTAGHYQDTPTIQYIAPTPIPGGALNGSVPQLSLVTSLRGQNYRQHAGKGRMYFPPGTGTGGLDSSGRVSVTTAQNHAIGVRRLLGIVLDSYATAGINAVPGIASNVGSGAFQAVAAIRVGRVVDTMRSRRNKLLEDPQEVNM